MVSQEDCPIEMVRVHLGDGVAAPPVPRTPLLETATTASTCLTLAFSLSATAVTSAPHPHPHANAMPMPVDMWPWAVSMAAPTEPAEPCAPQRKAPHTVVAAAITGDLAAGRSWVSPNPHVCGTCALIPRDGATVWATRPGLNDARSAHAIVSARRGSRASVDGRRQSAQRSRRSWPCVDAVRADVTAGTPAPPTIVLIPVVISATV